MKLDPILVLILLVSVIGMFFWGVFRAIKTQRVVYLTALLPFIVLMVTMFFI